MNKPTLSIVVPAYHEAENLPLLHERLAVVFDATDVIWELIVVDDHSGDETFGVIQKLSSQDARVRGYRLARNFGSHMAIACGLEQARGDCAVVMAADLQDPPEVIPELLNKWQAGDQVVWAVRAEREGQGRSAQGFSGLYYWIMRRIVGLREMPSTGADFFLIDRRVIDSLADLNENNVSIFAMITWMGFRQSEVSYDKQARLHGSSGWSLEKKLKLVVDSVTAFTYLPIRLMSYVGFGVALLGFIYAIIVVVNALLGRPPEGWSSIMVVVLVVGGIQMVMMGVLGEYLWRALDEARRRPRYIVEAETEHL